MTEVEREEHHLVPDIARAQEPRAGEGVLTRWSRRKLQALDGAEPPPEQTETVRADLELPAAVTETEFAPDAAPPADVRSSPPELPALHSLGAGSDYRPFMSREVSAELRRLALRKLFHQPAFNVTDGLDDYAGDFTAQVPLGDVVTHEMRRAWERKARSFQGQAEHAVVAAGADADDGTEVVTAQGGLAHHTGDDIGVSPEGPAEPSFGEPKSHLSSEMESNLEGGAEQSS